MSARTTVSDFSSAQYWATRFTTETSFEWLLPSSKIIAFILENFRPTTKNIVKCLHLGCGTSSLGLELEEAFKQAMTTDGNDRNGDVQVVDTDYVAESISSITQLRPIIPLNALDLSDLIRNSEDGWDLIIDKSTADAISCGPLIADIEPINVLCWNLAKVTKKGMRWISISYSSTRFTFLDAIMERGFHATKDRDVGEGVEDDGDESKGGDAGTGGEEGGWKVVERRFLASTSLPDGRRWRDESGVERVVFEPETGVWGWVLERV